MKGAEACEWSFLPQHSSCLLASAVNLVATRMKDAQVNSLLQLDSPATMPAMAPVTRPNWEQVEGSPLPLGATWIESEQAFNFAVHAEHAESVTLLLYS